MTSWGVLLSEANRIEVFRLSPWLLTPALPLILTVMSFNFLGDGLRDVADPFSSR
jgi:peptide/nickel transport system permease protein